MAFLEDAFDPAYQSPDLPVLGDLLSVFIKETIELPLGDLVFLWFNLGGFCHIIFQENITNF